MADLPVGTVTFLFTDIEGSTRMVQHLGDAFPAVLHEHNTIVRTAIDDCGGTTIRTEGDSFFAVFSAAPDAIAAAVNVQRALATHQFPGGVELRVRIGLHTGIGKLGGDDYVGIDVHRAARIADAGNGGQVLLSAATLGLSGQSLPVGVDAVDLGEHHLKDLERPESLYRLVVDGAADNPAPPRSLVPQMPGLPDRLDSFVGRVAELRQVRELLGETRLLTLTGPGGTGKTRLALELGETVASEFSDGVGFVPLAGISDHRQVATRILEVFPEHIADAKMTVDAHLEAYLTARSMLLILDNFEHVIEAAPLISQLLAVSSGTKILVTSRGPLQIAGEQEMPVPPLQVPDIDSPGELPDPAGFDSITLFVERARAVRPTFELDDSNGADVAELVARLDGLPLAIELAASRVRALSPRAILDNLSHVLASGSRRDLPIRQQTVYNTIAWSYDMLPGSAAELLASMSVFAGGAGLAEIGSVVGQRHSGSLLDDLETLAGHSLIRGVEQEGSLRFYLLETVRQFGQERLVESSRMAPVKDAHARAFFRIVADAEPHLTAPDSGRWLDLLSLEHDNIRAAQQWAVDKGDLDRAYEMASSLWRFFHMRGLLPTARRLLAELLAVPGASTESRAKALEAAGGVAYWSGDMEEAYSLYSEALDLLRQIGDRRGIAYGLYNLGFARNYVGQADRGKRHFEDAYAIFEELEDRGGMAAATWGLGDVWAATGNLEEASRCFERAIAEFELLGDTFSLGWALYTQGEILVRLGEYDVSRDHLERGLALFDGSDLSAVVMFLAAFAALEIASGSTERGARIAGAMTGLRDETGTDLVRVGISYASEFDPDAFGLADGEFAHIYEEGRRMTAQDAIAFALRRGA